MASETQVLSPMPIDSMSNLENETKHGSIWESVEIGLIYWAGLGDVYEINVLLACAPSFRFWFISFTCSYFIF
jgi:hypothetical protein